MKDAKGRPIIVVTGTGIVTALGEGKQDNWAALTSGRSGIHTITRFPTEGLRTTIGGTIDFIEADPFNCSELTTEIAKRAASEAVEQSARARAPISPARCSWQCRRSRWNGRCARSCWRFPARRTRPHTTT